MLSFHVKFVQTDRRTTVKLYAPDLSIRGHKNVFHRVENRVVTSNFFLECFQKAFFSSGRKESLFCSLTFSHTMTPFDGSMKEAFKNIAGKGEIACTSNFSFSHNVFYSIKDRNYNFCCI